MTRPMNLRSLLLVFVASILFVTGFQIIDHLLRDTPLRFDVITLLLLPGFVFLMLLAYRYVTSHLVSSLPGKSPFWTSFRVSWVEYMLFFLFVLGYTDLSDVILREETYGAADVIATIVGALLGGALLAWVDPKKKNERESVESGSTV